MDSSEERDKDGGAGGVESTRPKPTLSMMGRELSMKDREHFGDVESEGEDEDDRGNAENDPHSPSEASALSWSSANSARKTKIRRRRTRRRSSRTNSISDRSSSVKDNEGPARKDSRCSSDTDTATTISTSTSTSSTDTEDHAGRRVRPPNPRRRRPGEQERAVREKVAEIDRAINMEYEGDGLELLRELAAGEDGLLDDEIRRKAWPVLANVPRIVLEEVLPSQEECEAHPEYRQVVLDVDRSLKRFPPGIKEEERPGLQDQLTRLIVRVLIKHGPSVHYYQGYHDVAITFLLVVGEEMGYHIMQRLTLTHLKEFMAPTMERTTFLLNYVYPILERESPQLHDFLEQSEVGTIFALPWLITWFAHVLPDYEDVVRLYDFFLAKPPLMPVYLAAALILHREQEVLLCECDMAMVNYIIITRFFFKEVKNMSFA